jgi:hypothetical protein
MLAPFAMTHLNWTMSTFESYFPSATTFQMGLRLSSCATKQGKLFGTRPAVAWALPFVPPPRELRVILQVESI